MILKHYINREVLLTSAAILMVLVLIFISSRFISYIQLAVEGVIPSSTVFQLVALKIPSVAGFLLPLSFFIAILMSHGRLYSDNEMAVIKSVGVSDWQLAKNMVPLALFLAFLAGALSFWLNPWATQAAKTIQAQGQAEAKLSHFLPGRFKENDTKTGVAFIESKTDSGDINQLFSVAGLKANSFNADELNIQSNIDKKPAIELTSNKPAQKNNQISDYFSTETQLASPEQLVIQLAQVGKITTTSRAALADNKPTSTGQKQSNQQDTFLQLQQGVLYVFDYTTQQWQVTQYQDYYMPVEKSEAKTPKESTRSAPSLVLIESGDTAAIAELHWRLSAPISIIILGFMAVPLARTQPRKGKFSKLLPALMIYLIYAVLLMNGRKLIESGNIPEVLGFWWIHLLAIGFCLWSYKKARFTQTKASKKWQKKLNKQAKKKAKLIQPKNKSPGGSAND